MRMARAVVIAAVLVTFATRAWADEADNFTCRGRISRDSVVTLDGWVNTRIDQVIARANRAGRGSCDTACVIQFLQEEVGANARRKTLIPQSALGKWLESEPSIDRCHLQFRDTIYGARAYHHPWLYPFLGRIIFVSDSILLNGRVVGLDKIDHFIREGLEHWRFIERSGGGISESITREMGAPHRQLKWTEWGVKGMSLTGVLAYADIAAGYFGYRFWHDALSLGTPESFVSYDATTKAYARRRTFTFRDYVNDAWDESINCSTFDERLGKEVAAALNKRNMVCGGGGAAFAALPDARLYVNPASTSGSAPRFLAVSR